MRGMPNRLLILVVEDDDDIRALVADFLEDCEYRVASANERGVGADIMRALCPSLVVADVNLRGGNGDDLAQLARTMDIPILLISGEPKTIERHQGNVVEFMQKPFRLAELLAKIREMIVSRP
jgi:two-component system, OmpR family, response regulator